MAKMQPFWWFRAPPYVYPCWYNTCESCGDWTLDPELSCALDAINKKQGSSAVKISKGAAAGSGYTYAKKVAVQCAEWFGIWVRANLSAANRAWTIMLWKDSTHYALAEFLITGATPQLTCCVYDGALFCDASPPAVSSLTWYWLEIRLTSALTSFYLNEAHIWSRIGGTTPYPTAELRVRAYKDFAASDLWLDWARWFASQEYPPSYPY